MKKTCYKINRGYWYYEDPNGYIVENIKVFDLIGSEYNYNKYSIVKHQKEKYSPNKSNKGGGWSGIRSGNTPETREYNKRYLQKIIKELKSHS